MSKSSAQLKKYGLIFEHDVNESIDPSDLDQIEIYTDSKAFSDRIVELYSNYNPNVDVSGLSYKDLEDMIENWDEFVEHVFIHDTF